MFRHSSHKWLELGAVVIVLLFTVINTVHAGNFYFNLQNIYNIYVIKSITYVCQILHSLQKKIYIHCIQNNCIIHVLTLLAPYPFHLTLHNNFFLPFFYHKHIYLLIHMVGKAQATFSILMYLC